MAIKADRFSNLDHQLEELARELIQLKKEFLDGDPRLLSPV
jgi:hypothetical protein